MVKLLVPITPSPAVTIYTWRKSLALVELFTVAGDGVLLLTTKPHVWELPLSVPLAPITIADPATKFTPVTVMVISSPSPSITNPLLAFAPMEVEPVENTVPPDIVPQVLLL